MTKPKMIEPDFWKAKGRYDQKKLSRESKNMEKWLKAEQKYLKSLPVEETKPKVKKGDTTMEQVLHHAKERRGRPKGSKNKPKTEAIAEPIKRGRGRPKGSKNKPKEGR